MNVPEKQQTGGDFTMARPDTRSILIFLGIGLLAGWLASLILGGGGLLTFLISGVIGAFVGGWLFGALNINLPIRNPFVSQIITSTVGAIIVLIVARLIAG
jgi:uncharacterized membrane protein YeaQ/YmgE (transglycosylase-associated protein family)